MLATLNYISDITVDLNCAMLLVNLCSLISRSTKHSLRPGELPRYLYDELTETEDNAKVFTQAHVQQLD